MDNCSSLEFGLINDVAQLSKLSTSTITG